MDKGRGARFEGRGVWGEGCGKTCALSAFGGKDGAAVGARRLCRAYGARGFAV